MVLRVLSHTSSVQCLIRLEMRKWEKNRIEEILVSNSSLVSGPYEASGDGVRRCQDRVRHRQTVSGHGGSDTVRRCQGMESTP